MPTKSDNVVWYGKEFESFFEKKEQRFLDAAAIAYQGAVIGSFGDSGASGSRSGATRQERAANRSATGGPPNVDTGHLKRNIGFAKPAGRPRTRIVGTGIGGKSSVGYATWLEKGTRYIPEGRPYLLPMLVKMRSKFRSMAKRMMKF